MALTNDLHMNQIHLEKDQKLWLNERAPLYIGLYYYIINLSLRMISMCIQFLNYCYFSFFCSDNYRDCEHAKSNGNLDSNIMISPDGGDPFTVACNHSVEDGGWTVRSIL